MRHYPVESGTNRHYAVGHNGIGGVLVQLGEDISVEPYHCQVRVCLTIKEAQEMMALLQQAVVKALEIKYEGPQQTPAGKEAGVDVSCVQGVDGQGQEAVQDVQA